MADPQVTDEREHSRFTLEVDGHVGELVYRVEGDRLVLVHTGVPDELGGRGLGGVLVRAALQRAASDGLTVVPRCPFARSWLRKHAEEAGTVAVDWPDDA